MNQLSTLCRVIAFTAFLLSSPGWASSPTVTQLSQHGVTWKFDRAVHAGQFVTGDWWVVGPVTVTEVTPAPGPSNGGAKIATPKNRWGDTSLKNDPRMRNGSMIVLKAGPNHGYDSRSRSYRPELSVRFPVTLDPNNSLISTISNTELPVRNFAEAIMWPGEKRCQNLLKTAAVLTVLPEAPPADAFRPTYAGTEKEIYRASDLNWSLLMNLPAPSVNPRAYPSYYTLRPTEDWEQMARYFSRPWLEHVRSWEQQQLNPSENQPNYGRECARLVSIASLMLQLDSPREKKENLLLGLVQYGIDIAGVAKVGGSWNEGGGHSSGRKWPAVFASLMLDAPALRTFGNDTVFQEDSQTYYGTGWCGQTALYWMIQHHGRRERYEEKPPEEWEHWDQITENYRVCCNAVAWVGTALAVRQMGAIETWGHDAYFDYCDRWMAERDPYAEFRGQHSRPRQEGSTRDPFVDAMWREYRDSSPKQPMAGDHKTFLWTQRGFEWVANPKPTAEQVEAHLSSLRRREP